MGLNGGVIQMALGTNIPFQIQFLRGLASDA